MTPGTGRQFAQPVVFINPGEPVRDSDDTAWLPGPPAETPGRADIWPLNVQQQVQDAGGVIVADYGAMFPVGAPVTSQTRVRDVATGVLYRVYGRPEPRSSLLTGQPDHIGARLKFISDDQGAPS